MEDLSNRTLAILIGIAIIISISGILAIPKQGVTFLGAVTNTTTGVANVSIQSVTQIRLNNATVDFGIGFVNSTSARCILESNNSNRYDSAYTTVHPCDKVGGGPGFNAPAITSAFVIENVGNVNVTLQINSSFFGGGNSTTANGSGAYCGNSTCGTPGFLCDQRTTSQNCTLGRAEYNWSASGNDAAGACTSNSGVASRNSFNQTFNGSLQVVCTNMDFNPSQNEIRVAVRLAIPRDSKVGLLNDTILFQADTG